MMGWVLSNFIFPINFISVQGEIDFHGDRKIKVIGEIIMAGIDKIFSLGKRILMKNADDLLKVRPQE